MPGKPNAPLARGDHRDCGRLSIHRRKRERAVMKEGREKRSESAKRKKRCNRAPEEVEVVWITTVSRPEEQHYEDMHCIHVKVKANCSTSVTGCVNEDPKANQLKQSFFNYQT